MRPNGLRVGFPHSPAIVQIISAVFGFHRVRVTAFALNGMRIFFKCILSFQNVFN